MSLRGRDAGFTLSGLRRQAARSLGDARGLAQGALVRRLGSVQGEIRKDLRRFVSEVPGQISTSGLERNFHFKKSQARWPLLRTAVLEPLSGWVTELSIAGRDRGATGLVDRPPAPDEWAPSVGGRQLEPFPVIEGLDFSALSREST
jgi:hypothetical protein